MRTVGPFPILGERRFLYQIWTILVPSKKFWKIQNIEMPKCFFRRFKVYFLIFATKDHSYKKINIFPRISKKLQTFWFFYFSSYWNFQNHHFSLSNTHSFSCPKIQKFVSSLILRVSSRLKNGSTPLWEGNNSTIENFQKT